MSNEEFLNGMTFNEYMSRESEFSDVSRALLSARHNNDFTVKNSLLAQVGIEYDTNDPACKMIDWLINLANSFAAGLSAVTETPVSDLIMMDATAYYEVEKIIFDRLGNQSDS